MILNKNYIEWIYKESLYYIDNPDSENLIKVVGNPYFGDNKENISVFIENTELDFYKTEDFLFLTKVMEVMSLTPNEYVIINLLAYKVDSWEQIQEKFNPSVILSFTQKIPSFLPHNIVKTYHPIITEKFCYLHADSLSTIQKNKEAKKKLWAGIKRLFQNKQYRY